MGKSKKLSDQMKQFEKEMDAISQVPWPITDFWMATKLKMDMSEFEDFLKQPDNETNSDQYKAMKRSHFYRFSLENKIAKGIDLYIAEEINKYSAIDDLKVIVDITEYQKQLQPFTQNQESISITNPRNKITRPVEDEISEEELSELEEYGVEIKFIDEEKK